MEEGKINTFELAIARTLAWFSLFEYPLTSFGIWKNLYQPDKKYSLVEVEKALSESWWLSERIRSDSGFYFWLKEKEEDIVALHQQRFLDAVRKYKKLRRAARYFSLFPFVRAVFACNNLPWHNTSSGSDIDLFVVVEPGTIWLSRLLLVFPFAIFKNRPNSHSSNLFSLGRAPRALPYRQSRPTGEALSYTPRMGEGGVGADQQSPKQNLTPLLPHFLEDPERRLGVEGLTTTPDPFCFSFFTTIDNLNFKNLLLFDEDPYFTYWLASLVPIFDRDEVQKKILQENNWLKEILPNAFGGSSHEEIFPRRLITLPLGFLKKFEKTVRYWQKKLLPCEIHDVANRDSRVVVSDQMLKFHTNDRRVHFRDVWQKILAKNL